MKLSEKSIQFIRFCIVGIICTAIDACVFYLLRKFISYEIALIAGYVTGLLFNYILTIYWTFKAHPTISNVIGIITAHLINLFIIRLGLMKLFVDILKLNDNIAYIPMLAISVLCNYYMIRFVVYKSNGKR